MTSVEEINALPAGSYYWAWFKEAPSNMELLTVTSEGHLALYWKDWHYYVKVNWTTTERSLGFHVCTPDECALLVVAQKMKLDPLELTKDYWND